MAGPYKYIGFHNKEVQDKHNSDLSIVSELIKVVVRVVVIVFVQKVRSKTFFVKKNYVKKI